MLRSLIVAGALVIGGVAFAQTAEDTQPAVAAEQTEQAPQNATPTAEADRDDVVICRTFRTLGSRLNRERICRTRAEWRGEAQDAANAVNETGRAALRTCIPNASGSCGQ
jgi:hypothetical protein